MNATQSMTSNNEYNQKQRSSGSKARKIKLIAPIIECLITSSCFFHEGTLKWNSQEITKAKTIQASKKLRNRWPCQKFRVSVAVVVPPWAVAVDMASLASFHCSISSASFAPATFVAIDPQISHVLRFRL